MGISLLTAFSSGFTLYILSTKFMSLDLITATLIVYISITISSLPITIGGTGVTEGVIIASFYQHPISVSALLAVLYRISSYIVPLITSAMLLASNRLGWFNREFGE